MTFFFYHVDAFTNKPFCGNQAGVCFVTETPEQETMQQIASENNLPVTAFVKKTGDKFSLRWFTPTAELPLCGHGTLAAAHVLWEENFADKKEVIFETCNGDLKVERLKSNWIELKFPSFTSHLKELPQDLLNLFSDAIEVSYTNDRYLIELGSENEVRNFQPAFEKLKGFSVIITSKAKVDSTYDFISRYFAFPVGVPEDQVTGSAHSSLAPYWSAKLGKTNMIAYQASSRGGILRLTTLQESVLIAGQAITVFKGEYRI